ncbi:MAG TPA: hypothetical protein VGM88_10455 [Kofleriaceae bacterium]|jgi:hypothetical protein
MSGPDERFRDLRRLADWFSTSPQRASIHIERIVARLGGACVPLLCRELASSDPRRREAARDALSALADEPDQRARVVGALRAIAVEAIADEAKVVALGLLAELGEAAEARFSDPTGIQRRSALALAAQIETAADIASAADLMVQQLAGDAIVEMIEIMAEAAAPAAHRLAAELAVRLDVPLDVRDRVIVAAAAAAAAAPPIADEPSRRSRAATVAVLVDAAARLVVVASKRIGRRARRWAVLIDANGAIEECLHEDPSPEPDAAPLVARLVADGYRVACTDPERARTIVGDAARKTGAALASSYYLGRDLLALGAAHAGDTRRATGAIDRALEHLSAGDASRALALLDHIDGRLGDRDAPNPDLDAARAAALLLRQPLAPDDARAAIALLDRALAAEPTFALHHWNRAVALRALGESAAEHRALAQFIAASASPSGLFADPAQPGRVACAERLLAEVARTARLHRPARRTTRARRLKT